MIQESTVQSDNRRDQDLQSILSLVLKNLGVNDLNRIQKLAVECGALQGASLLVVAPSGSGKTLVGLIAALRLIVEEYDNRMAVFLVPLKALAWQQYEFVRRALGDKRLKAGIDTGDFSANNEGRGNFPNHQLLVMTYERFDSLIRRKVWWLKRIKLLVIDEINYLADKRRGPRLEATIVRLKENMAGTQLVAFSPPVRNAPQLAEWLECKLISESERPIPLRLQVLLAKDKMKSLVELCTRNISQGGSAIVFASSRSKANQVAVSLLGTLRKILTDEETAKSKSLARRLLANKDEIPNITRKLASVVEGGVAFHHAGLRIEDRQVVEEGFTSGIIKAVACTTTLGTGINTPARIVIIMDTSYLDIEPSWSASPSPKLRRIEPDRLHQMLGRAGRPGYDKLGIGVVLVENRAEDEFVRKTYFKRIIGQSEALSLEPALPTIESKMNSEFALIEQLLIRIYECGECKNEDLIHFLGKTLWWKSRTNFTAGAPPKLNTESYNVRELLDTLKKSNDNQKPIRSEQTSLESKQESRKEDQEKQDTSVAVRIVSISKQRIEARVQEHWNAWIGCSFSFRNGAKCECEENRLQSTSGELTNRGRFCSHLIAVAEYLVSLPATKLYAEQLIAQSLSNTLPLDRLLDDGMIYTVADKYRCTELGQVAAVMYLHPLTVLFLKNAFKRLHTDDELELDPMINIAIKAALVETGERSSLIGKGGVERALAEWIDEIPEKEILGTRYIDSGDFHELTENVSRMSSGASVTARLLGLMKLSKQFSVLSKRIRYGVRDDLIPLMDLSIPSLGRKSIRKLYSLGYVDLKELARAPSEEIVKLANLPESTVSVIKKYAKRLAELN